jgi:hypothetical protein
MTLKSLPFLLTGILALGGPALAERDDSAAPAAQANGELTLALAGANVWRGEIADETLCLQPGLTIMRAPFALNLWGAFDLDDGADARQRERLHLVADHTLHNGRHIFRSGIAAVRYGADKRDDFSQHVFELFADYALDTALLPSLSLHYEVGNAGGLYACGALRHLFVLIDNRADLEVRGGLGWGDRNYIEKRLRPSALDNVGPRWTEASLRVALPVRPAPRLTVTPSIEYFVMADSALRTALRAEQRHESLLWGQLALSAEF